MVQAEQENRRVLIVDSDDQSHARLREILATPELLPDLTVQPGPMLGGIAPQTPDAWPKFDLCSAYQGHDGYQRVADGLQSQRPFAVAFIDGRMPPDWDGMETAARMLAVDPHMHIVLCTRESEFSLAQIIARFGFSDRLMILRKPFDSNETFLLAVALTERWMRAQHSASVIAAQADDIADVRQVLKFIQQCHDELVDAHEDLQHYSSELTHRLQSKTEELLGTRDLTVYALAQLADSRDPETGEHLMRMRAYAQLLAEHLAEHGPYTDEIDPVFLEDFYRSTPLHDIGKVGIPDHILLKPGRLTVEEFEIMKKHTLIGAEALNKASDQTGVGHFLKLAAEIARSHHERFDGSGYPDGLAGLDIPLSARITAVADVFDALTSARVYKAAISWDDAREIIESESNKHFDPVVVDAFLAVYDQFDIARREVEKVAEGNQNLASITASVALPT